MKHNRCEKLFQDKFTQLKKARILILGVGGVGGYALDCLYKSGIEDITIVDYDVFEESNQNRQIGSEAVGALKTTRLKELYPSITPIKQKITPQWVKSFDFSPFDVVIDAIDDIPSKIELICTQYSKLLSTTGSAKRIDPSKIEYTDIYKTYNDPFARKIRELLKKRGFHKKFRVVFSSENPQCQDMGSFVGVTGSFGLHLCSLAIGNILK